MELLQEAEVGAVEQTNVVNTVTHHNKSVKTDIYVKSGILIGVKSRSAENVGMRSAAGHYLDPAYVLTNAASLSAANKASHVYLKSGLNEREKSCSHTNGNVLTEHLGENALDHYLTCGISEVLIYDKCLVLEECALVTGIGGFISVNASGIYESVGGLMCLHIAYAISRKVRTQAELIVCRTGIVSLEPIGIHALASGMVGREVKIVECVIFACYLRTRKYLKAHRTECIVKIIAHLSYGVKSTYLGLKSGDSAVKVCGDLGSLKLECLASALYLLSKEALNVVDCLSHFGTERNVKLGDLLKKLGDASLLSEKRALYLLQLSLRLCRFDLRSTLFK